MNPLKREIDQTLRALTLSPGLKRRTLARIERYEEENNMKKRYKLSSALIVAMALLLAGVAYAAVARLGVLDLLMGSHVIVTEKAQETILTSLDHATVTVGEAQFELVDAAYDGQRIYISLSMRSDTQTVQGMHTWEDEGLKPGIYGGVQSVAIDGQDTDFEPANGQNEADIAYDIISVPYQLKPGTPPQITLGLCAFNEDASVYLTGELRFTLPIESDTAQTVTIDEPITLNGVTVTSLELKYTPLKLYAKLTYTIDPALPRFERLRRENMFLELSSGGTALQGYGGYSGNENTDTYTVTLEFAATDTPYQQLSAQLEGRDGEIYWQYDLNFEEATT